MSKKPIILGLLIALAMGAILIGSALPTRAAPLAQMTSFPTPTPGRDGRIVYIVQNGDSLWRISAVADIPLDELRLLNNLGSDEVITPGQQLLLGLGGPAGVAPTSGPPPTPTSELPTPTPGVGTGTICVLLYEDINGDSIRQEEEPSLPGGIININDRLGKVSFTIDTPSGGLSDVLFPDPEELGFTCFAELEKGEYNITAAIPDGYNATTRLSYAVQLLPEAENYYDFGAQPNTETLAEAPAPAGTGKSPPMGILGVILLAGGIGLGVYSAVFRRK